jgi:uncharacterized protein (TIGR02569 family)
MRASPPLARYRRLVTARPDERLSGGVPTDVDDHRLDELLPVARRRPPDHVLTAFNAPVGEPAPLAGGQDRSWRAGNTVIKPVDDPAEASWLAGVFEQRPVPGVRVARPVRSTDGRWVVSGWTAHRFVSGGPAPRFDEMRRAGQALHAAVADVPVPRFLRERTDLFSWADRLAWGEVLDTDGRLGHGHGATVYRELAALRRPVAAPNQIVHGNLYPHVLFAGDADPAVIAVTPYWRPAAWAIGVLAVDAVCRGDAPIELLDDWADGPDWPQLVRRAVLFRLAVSLAHPRTPADHLVVILSTAERVDRFLR